MSPFIHKQWLNLFLFLSGFCLLKMTGGLLWYVDFMDDIYCRDIYKRIKYINKQRKRVMKCIIGSCFSSTSGRIAPTLNSLSWHDLLFQQRLRYIQKETQVLQWFKRHSRMALLVDTIAFYLIYISCTSTVSTYLTESMIQTPKIDILNGLPSNEFNITNHNGYHPSLVNRYLTSSMTLYTEDDDDDDDESKYHIDETLAHLLLQDDISIDKNDEFESNNRPICPRRQHNDHVLINNTCAFQNELHYLSNLNEFCETGGNNNELILSRIAILREMEERWSRIDDEYIQQVISPYSYTAFFGSYETAFVTPQWYFLFYAFSFCFSLLLLAKVGVPAESVFA